MIDIVAVASLAVGLALLVAGGDVLVRGAARLAALARISPLVIGLTVVAFGTSAPELAVSAQSALGGQGAIALGNVVGSNIFNVLFILGLSALIAPLVVSEQLVRLDVPLMLGASVLALALAFDGNVGTLDGALLFAGIIAYTAWSVRVGRAAGAAAPAEVEIAPTVLSAVRPRAARIDFLAHGSLVLLGLALLVLGSRALVSGAVTLALAFGVSELVIGLTIVAAGTSLPEVAASVIAALRGQREIAVGNVVGSNIFNLLAALGLSGLAAPGGVPVPATALSFDLPVMLAVALACVPIFYTGRTITRWEGALFLGYYAAYTAHLVLDSSGHPSFGAFRAFMALVVMPLTALLLAGSTIRRIMKITRKIHEETVKPGPATVPLA